MEWDEKTALAEGFYRALSRRDIEAALTLLDDEAEADWSRSRGPHAGVYRGRNGVRKFLESFLDSWAEGQFFTEELVPSGDALVRTGGFRGVGQENGIAIEGKGAQLIAFRGGKIWRVTLFQSREDALAAANPDRPS